MKGKNLSKLLLLITILLSSILSFIVCLKIGFSVVCFGVFFCFWYTCFCFLCVSCKFILYKFYIYLNEKEFKDDNIEFEYYRNLIDNYSISNLVLCYGKANYRDELVCIFLKLLINKKIKIANNKVEVIDETGLNNSETMFIKLFKGYKIYGKNVKKYVYEDNISDSLECDLFVKDSIKDESDFYTYIFTFNFIVWLLTVLLMFFENVPTIYLLNIFVFWACFMMILVRINLSTKKILPKSKKGIEIQKKLFGLRNYLKSFTLIDTKSIKELGLWEYYMIYALLFNIKGNLNEEAKEIYSKYIQPYMQ